ncbi:MAG: sodium:solute symporter [Bacteroidaceae bacterium]|nr:sodium:solute symporter [Bacteroidaceae bacterium]
MLVALLVYFAVLLLVSFLTGGGGNDAFFRGNRRSPWMPVAFGMVGASISGLTFIGVPGWVMGIDMTYMQMCLGFVVGYVLVAFVLLPIYYRLGLTSIYTYLDRRLGRTSYRTGAWFFIGSKMAGAAAKFYVVVEVLQTCFADAYGVPYGVTAVAALLFIWLYTRRGGIRTLVWTDVLQTFVLIAALLVILLKVCGLLGMGFPEAMEVVWKDPHSRMFEFGDFASKQNFWKQFLSGVFIVVVMTGLDQDMMQKNLTCRNLRSAQWDMCCYGVLFVPVNFLFLSLGVLLLMLYGKWGMILPESGDALLSNMVCSGALGEFALGCFTIGVVASAFSSADSSLTALTTCYCVDIADFESSAKQSQKQKREVVHLCMMSVFLLCTLAFHAFGSGSVMDLIYTLVGYTYGPLLGLFTFGIFTKRKPREKMVPFIAAASPAVCYLTDFLTYTLTGYRFGYELLMFNGLLTFAGLWLTSKRPAS